MGPKNRLQAPARRNPPAAAFFPAARPPGGLNFHNPPATGPVSGRSTPRFWGSVPHIQGVAPIFPGEENGHLLNRKRDSLHQIRHLLNRERDLLHRMRRLLNRERDSLHRMRHLLNRERRLLHRMRRLLHRDRCLLHRMRLPPAGQGRGGTRRRGGAEGERGRKEIEGGRRNCPGAKMPAASLLCASARSLSLRG